MSFGETSRDFMSLIPFCAPREEVQWKAKNGLQSRKDVARLPTLTFASHPILARRVTELRSLCEFICKM